MFAAYIKVTAVVFVICSGLLFVRLITVTRHNPVDDLVVQSSDCNSFCLFQIEPGRTTVGQAKSHLRDNDWIVDVREFAPGNGYAQVSWGWSGTQPAIIDTSRRGKLTFVWDDDDIQQTQINEAIVESIIVYSHASLYLFEEHYGTPINGAVNNQLEGLLGYAVYYNRTGGNIGIHIEVQCPASFVQYWVATARITLSMGHIKSDYVPPIEMTKMC